ncbi:MAG: hypothetical protein ACYDCO_10715 [Armatimonadota bacterium]
MQRRFYSLLVLVSVTVCGLLIGLTASSRGAADAPAVPDPEEQRMYLGRARAEHDAKVAWQPLHSFTFDDVETLKALRVCEGEWQIADGQLQAVGGKPDDYRAILLAPCPAGPMRIEFDATLYPRPDGRVGDIYIRLNADDTGSSVKGYGLFVARYFNQDSVCYKNNQPIARTEWSPIVPGQQHHIVAEWHTVHLRLWVDGKVVIDAWDRTNPIPVDPQKWIGLASYDTRMAVDNLVISTAKGR